MHRVKELVPSFVILMALVSSSAFGGLDAECDGIRFLVPPQTIWQADQSFTFAREPLLARLVSFADSLLCMLLAHADCVNVPKSSAIQKVTGKVRVPLTTGDCTACRPGLSSSSYPHKSLCLCV